MKYKLLQKSDIAIVNNNKKDLYSYTVFKGHQSIDVSDRDSCWVIDLKNNLVKTVTNTTIESETLAVIIYGYKPFDRVSEINDWTTLPYVNGCSTTQLLPPIRKGDPTFQLLRIPPFSSEQAHHIHSTARIVYVYKGRGKSVIGMEGKMTELELEEGQVLILDKMVPHHFVTEDEPLVVIPLHIFSSTGKDEYDHPMFNGTHLV